MMILRSLGLAAIALAAAQSACAQAPAPSASEQVKLFELPAGAGVHDVAPAPDGKVWYTAQRGGALGILDPKTGQVRQVPLGPGSAPHGVIQGPDGAAWITDGGQNAIVRYDPKTEEIRLFKLPADAAGANLNTGAFDKDGNHWFTGQTGFYGVVYPKTGEVKVWRDPEGRGPYGITATPAGDIYYVSLAGSHVAKIDRKTGQATIIEPPTPDQGARRIWSDSRGNLWVSEWNSGQLSRYTPSTKEWKVWKLPGEKPQVYAVYVDNRDKVWITEWSANATLMFDPATEKWTSYPGSAPRANVRQILGRPGEILLPESGTNKIMIVRTN
jgi:virginiamycin B lyase